MAVLVTYASRHGSTRQIAERIAGRLGEAGHDAVVRPVDEVPDVAPYDGVVIGSAVYYGRWLRPAAAFVRRHGAALRERPVWLFSSGPLGEMPAEEPAALAAVREALRARESRVFAGALDRGRIGPVERLIAGVVSAPDGDFRQWGAIDAWADAIAGELAREVPDGARFASPRER